MTFCEDMAKPSPLLQAPLRKNAISPASIPHDDQATVLETLQIHLYDG